MECCFRTLKYRQLPKQLNIVRGHLTNYNSLNAEILKLGKQKITCINNYLKAYVI